MNDSKLNNELYNLAETILNGNHSLSYKMKGFSMYPTLRPGDIGLVEKFGTEEYKVGDIVVFKSNGILVGHRLIEINIENGERIYITRGDKSPRNDAPFRNEDLLGKITSFERKNRKIKINSPLSKMRKFSVLHFHKHTLNIYNFMLRNENRINSLFSNLRSIKRNVSIVSKGSEKVFIINAVISVLQGIIPFIIIVCIKSLVDYLSISSTQNIREQLFFISLLIGTALVFLLSAVLSEIKTLYSEKLSQSITRRIYEKLHKKHALLDLSNYENPDKQDKIHRAVQEASFRPIKIMNALLLGIKSIASVLFLIGLFISIKWYLVVILLIAIIPDVFVRLKFSKKLYELKDSQSTKEREMYYYNRILTGFPFAKELKLFGFSDFFLKRFSKVQETLYEQKISLRKSELRLGIFAQIFAVVLIFISLGYVSLLKINGEISIGTVVLFFFAFQRGYSVLNEFFRSITQILEDNTFLKDVIDFLNAPTRAKSISDFIVPFSLNKEIRFENVSFRYESSKRDALKSININIPAGKTVAFVGANGSGKTTLIKLLCGFYEPDSGRILFDGIDSNQIGQKVVCENITAVFQDFALYNIPVFENLGLGNIQKSFNLEKAKEAAKAAGIDDIIETLPNGYHTLLGNLFKGGEELSIGQWQKMAIARAFYRNSSLILMDEPSSALDANSEMQIINSLKDLSQGKTAVIVSHRLTTVQWADLIYFFQDGEVVESGSHNELMALKGSYFALFQTANKQFEES
ncbi:MAG: signal peptidase I [Paludibacter sp.]|nr:signal peptidase I [Paludibacter sp.]